VSAAYLAQLLPIEDDSNGPWPLNSVW